MVCVNKFDLNPDATRDIKAYAGQNNLTVVGEIPFDPVFTQSMIQGKTVIEYNRDSDGAQAVRAVWETISSHLAL